MIPRHKIISALTREEFEEKCRELPPQEVPLETAVIKTLAAPLTNEHLRAMVSDLNRQLEAQIEECPEVQVEKLMVAHEPIGSENVSLWAFIARPRYAEGKKPVRPVVAAWLNPIPIDP